MLEMYDDAWTTLDQLSPEEQIEESAMTLRLDLALSMERWDFGAEIAREAVQLHPQSVTFYLNGAYCIRRAESLESAYPFLKQARQTCDKLSALWHYNLACYEAQLGNLAAVGPLFRKAVAMEASFEQMGMSDPDLQPWRESAEHHSS